MLIEVEKWNINGMEMEKLRILEFLSYFIKYL